MKIKELKDKYIFKENDDNRWLHRIDEISEEDVVNKINELILAVNRIYEIIGDDDIEL